MSSLCKKDRGSLLSCFRNGVGIILYEGETPEKFVQEIGTSQEPFAVWFREKIKENHGFDLAQPMGPPPELVNDFHSE